MSSGRLVEDGHCRAMRPVNKVAKDTLVPELPCECINDSQIITASIVMIPVGHFFHFTLPIHTFPSSAFAG